MDDEYANWWKRHLPWLLLVAARSIATVGRRDVEPADIVHACWLEFAEDPVAFDQRVREKKAKAPERTRETATTLVVLDMTYKISRRGRRDREVASTLVGELLPHEPPEVADVRRLEAAVEHLRDHKGGLASRIARALLTVHKGSVKKDSEKRTYARALADVERWVGFLHGLPGSWDRIQPPRASEPARLHRRAAVVVSAWTRGRFGMEELEKYGINRAEYPRVLAYVIGRVLTPSPRRSS